MNEFHDERMEPTGERQDELLQTEEVHTLSDIVDAHSDTRWDLNVTTDGLDPALLQDEDPAETAVGFPGTFSNDGLGGAREDDALATDYDDEDVMAGEYAPGRLEEVDDITGQFGETEDEALSLDELRVLSGGVGDVDLGQVLPTGFQVEDLADGE